MFNIFSPPPDPGTRGGGRRKLVTVSAVDCSFHENSRKSTLSTLLITRRRLLASPEASGAFLPRMGQPHVKMDLHGSKINAAYIHHQKNTKCRPYLVTWSIWVLYHARPVSFTCSTEGNILSQNERSLWLGLLSCSSFRTEPKKVHP